MAIKLLLILLVCLLSSKFGFCHNVLIMHTFGAGSHVFTLRNLADSLVNRGHEVTIIRYLESHNVKPITNNNKITEIILSINNTDGYLNYVTHEENGRNIFATKHIWKDGLSISSFPMDSFTITYTYANNLLGNKSLIDHLRTKNFKLSIVDLFFNDAGLALSHYLGVPVVGFWFSFFFGSSLYTPAFNPPSVIPEVFTVFGDRMSFTERVRNFVAMILFQGVMQVGQFPLSYLAIKKHMPEVPHPSVLTANMSGVLIMSNPALDNPRLLPPTYVEVAGSHICPVKPLPQDILDFVESAGDDGLILFSLGFNFHAKNVPEEAFEGFFKAFSKLKQKVLVKTSTTPSFLPSNVKIMSYFPQADILAHNKTILFISHCGRNGMMEAIKYKVPVVGIPIFIDQQQNLVRLVEKGAAVALTKDAIPERIYDVIDSALKNLASMKENMNRLSKNVDTMGNPKEKAIWLLEYVMETGGAEHLKLSSRHLGIFKYLCIDVAIFLLFCVSLMLYLLYKSINFIYHHSNSVNIW